MKDCPLPSPLETQILRVLWQLGESTVTAVHEAMDDGKERAYTTVLTVLQNLEKKGLVHRVKQGRAHVYEAAFSTNDVLGPLLEDFVTQVYGGEWHELLQQAISQSRLTREQKSALCDQLQARGRKSTSAAKKAAKKVVKSR